MFTWFHNDLGLFFISCLSVTAGFVLAAILAVGERADAQERHEHISEVER